MPTFSLRRRLLLAAALAAGLPAMAAQPVQIQDARGSLDLPAPPKRIVVYDVSALDGLHALGVVPAGGPKAQLPAYFQDYASRYTPAGSLFQPDYEALSKIRPDLIIVGGRSASKYEVLSKIAPTVDFSVKGDHLLQDMERNVTQLARLYGKEAQGQALVQRVQQEVASLRAQAAKAQPGLLLLTLNHTLVPQAPGGRFGLLFDVLGAQSAITGKEVPPRGTPFTLDDVARLAPQWLYVIDRNTATGSAPGGGEVIAAQVALDQPQIKATPAGRKGQVVFLDPKGWYLMGSSGPTVILNNIQQLRQAYGAAGVQ